MKLEMKCGPCLREAQKSGEVKPVNGILDNWISYGNADIKNKKTYTESLPHKMKNIHTHKANDENIS
jgi:hypothetical protein